MSGVPQRVICLSAESADWLWRIGAWEEVMGVTAFFEAPSHAAPKPRVSGFSSANLAEITRLTPDLVITFSDVQADLAAALIRAGINVLATNQRTLEEIESTLELLARVMDRAAAGQRLLAEWRDRLRPVISPVQRPRVYFEEWDEPLISGIAWVNQLIERAGGEDIFARLREQRAASARQVTSEEVIQADPQIILASWCGKPFNAAKMVSRPGWDSISAVRDNRLHELPAIELLQPGFRLVEGYERLKKIIAAPS